MKKLLLLLVVLSFAVADDALYLQFKTIDEDEFGKTLIDTLQMHVQTGEPIQRFIDIMRDLETKIENEQRQEDQKNRAFSDQCDKDLDALQLDSALLERKLVEIQSNLDEFRQAVQQKTSIQTAKQAWKDELEKKIAELDAVRKAEKELFDQRVKEHEYAQYVIETVKRLFTNDDLSSSFLQTNNQAAKPEVIEKVISHLNGCFDEAQTQLIEKKSYFKMFKLLAQIAEGMQKFSDPALVNKIVQLCDQLLRNIEDSAQLDRFAEKRRENNYTKERQLLVKDLDKINNQLAQLAADILNLSDKIRNNEQDQKDYQARKDSKDKQVKDRSTECKSSALQYQKDREKRQQKRQLVSLIIGLFSANQRDFTQYVKLRHDAGDYAQ